MSHYAKNQFTVMKISYSPWKRNILIRISLSSLISILALTVLSNQFSSIRKVPEIFLPGIDVSILIRSLIVLILAFFVSYYILGKIQSVPPLLDRNKFWILSREKLLFIPISLLFLLCYIFELVNFVDLISGVLAGFFSAMLTFLFLKAWFSVGKANDNRHKE